MADNQQTIDDADKPASALETDALFSRLSGWCKQDWEHKKDWIEEAKEDFDFPAGRQWDDVTLQKLKSENRPASVFNRIAPMVDAVCGFEVANRQEVRYIPTNTAFSAKNELLTSAAMWFRDQSEAEDEESDAFRDAVICGVGCIETRIDYETNANGTPMIERVSPFEVFPAYNAIKPNFSDTRRVSRKREMPLEDAKALFPHADDELLHAGWATNDGTTSNSDDQEADAYDEKGDSSSVNSMVTVVEVVWWEREPFVRFVDSVTRQEKTLPKAEFDLLVERLAQIPQEILVAEQVGVPIAAVNQTKRVYKQAFLGKELLEPVRNAPTQDGFKYKFITGKRDENKGTFYGIVRSMKDPQRWTNKLFSQIMHILNSNAKGGWFAERGVFESDQQAAESIAKADKITWTNPGALQGGGLMPKPAPSFPAGQAEMLQFSIASLPMVTGINQEFLGMREANQPGVLEQQRKEAGITILATLFDSLRKYRKAQGVLMLELIKKYLSDGRLIKIGGEEQAQYLPLAPDATSGEYETIVDDAPTAPNSKEKNWAIIERMMPLLGHAMQMDPSLAAEVLKFSPLPDTLSQKIAAAIQPKNQAPQPPTPQQIEQMQLRNASQRAKINKDDASAEKARADAQATQAETFRENMEAFLSGAMPVATPPISTDLNPTPMPPMAQQSAPAPNNDAAKAQLLALLAAQGANGPAQ